MEKVNDYKTVGCKMIFLIFNNKVYIYYGIFTTPSVKMTDNKKYKGKGQKSRHHIGIAHPLQDWMSGQC